MTDQKLPEQSLEAMEAEICGLLETIHTESHRDFETIKKLSKYVVPGMLTNAFHLGKDHYTGELTRKNRPQLGHGVLVSDARCMEEDIRAAVRVLNRMLTIAAKGGVNVKLDLYPSSSVTAGSNGIETFFLVSAEATNEELKP